MSTLAKALTHMALSGMFMASFVGAVVAGAQFRQGKPALDNIQELNLRQFTRVYEPEVRKVFKSELHFMRIVCEPTKEQFDQIAADGEAGLQETVRLFALRALGHDEAGKVTATRKIPDPHRSMIQGIASSSRQRLSPQQAASYENELRMRMEAQKQTALASLLCKLDAYLMLRPEQRQQLARILDSNWNESMNLLEYYTSDHEYFPSMPDAEILPLLSEAQKVLWKGLKKDNSLSGSVIGLMKRFDIVEEVWLEGGK